MSLYWLPSEFQGTTGHLMIIQELTGKAVTLGSLVLHSLSLHGNMAVIECHNEYLHF